MGKLSTLLTWCCEVPSMLTSLSILSCLFSCGGNVASSYISTFQITLIRSVYLFVGNERRILSVLCLSHTINKRCMVRFNFLVLNCKKTVSDYACICSKVLMSCGYYVFNSPSCCLLEPLCLRFLSLILDLPWWMLLRVRITGSKNSKWL